VAHLYLADGVTGAAEGGTVVLEGDEGHHAAVVARMRVGERVLVGDGRGRIADAEATGVAKDRVALRVLAVRDEPAPSPRILLVQALAKGGRDELAIQAATELGVTAVAPWQAARSVTRWEGRKAVSGAARWAGIVREAGKQAMRAWSPEALPLLTTKELVALAGQRFTVLLDPEAPQRLVDAVPSPVPGGEVVLVVGPEGGVAPEEARALTDAGAVAARMGPTVLRTSTAGPAALAALAVHLGLWP
jgi:16S rRNA (uracil1498-N3)-methyltransferase